MSLGIRLAFSAPPQMTSISPHEFIAKGFELWTQSASNGNGLSSTVVNDPKNDLLKKQIVHRSDSIPIPWNRNQDEHEMHHRAYAMEYEYKRHQMLKLMQRVMDIEDEEDDYRDPRDYDSDEETVAEDSSDADTPFYASTTTTSQNYDDFEHFVFEI